MSQSGAPAPAPDAAPLGGQVALVTGANRGIGRATALGLARAGAHVILVVRDLDGGRRAARAIDTVVGRPVTDLVACDLSSQASIRTAASEVRAKHGPLHMLVNNAAVIVHRRTLTGDGIELQFAVNHLAYFLLTRELLEPLTAASGARVISVASDAHYRAHLDLDDVNFERRRYGGLAAYGQSKLANVLFTRELARRVADRKITANCLHPGVIATGLLGAVFRLPRVLHHVLRVPFGSPTSGARTTLFLATDPEVATETGSYFKRSRKVNPSRQAQDDGLARRLWAVSEGLVS